MALESTADVLWLLEIKTPAAVDLAVATIGRFLPARRLLVISFWHNVVHAVSRREELCELLIDEARLADDVAGRNEGTVVGDGGRPRDEQQVSDTQGGGEGVALGPRAAGGRHHTRRRHRRLLFMGSPWMARSPSI